MKKLIAFIALICISQLMLAENKHEQEVFFINKSNEAVVIDLIWKSNNKTDRIVRIDYLITKNSLDFNELMFSAPSHRYKLLNIRVATFKDLSHNDLNKFFLANSGGMIGAALGASLGEAYDDGARRSQSSMVPALSISGLIAGAAIGYSSASIFETRMLTFEANGNSFFVIDKVNGKIDIKGYPSQKHYEDEVAKTQN